MPRSKRNRTVHTSRVTKRPSKERSINLYTAVRAAACLYPHIFVFSVSNMRNTYLKDVRAHFAKDSKLFFGKTKVMAKALGTTKEDEAEPGLAELAGCMKGDVGLLCTESGVESVREYLDGFSELDFARAGTKAGRRFVVPAGVVYSRAGEEAEENDVPLPHSMEAMVRGWGMPTRLEKGRVTLDQEYVVCEEGKVLDSSQTALLKCFGIAMAEFRVRVVAVWSKESGEVEVLDQVDTEGMDED